jgi:hypothetical protein
MQTDCPRLFHVEFRRPQRRILLKGVTDRLVNRECLWGRRRLLCWGDRPERSQR